MTAYLPQCRDTPTIRQTDQLRPLKSGNGETVHVVDDDTDAREISAETLEQLGYRVSTAPDAARAFKAIEALSGVQLLFTDSGLRNGLDGYQLADLVCKRWPSTKILLARAPGPVRTIDGGHAALGHTILNKPFTLPLLAREVRRALDLKP